MTTSHKLLSALFISIATTVLAAPATVYYNGDILTMEGDGPKYVEAVLVKDDKIAFVGGVQDALAQAGTNANMHDLKGHTLLPGFIDTWGHFALIAQDTFGVNVAYFSKNPPKTKQELIDKLRKEGNPFNGWIIGTGYSEALLSDGAITLAELDKAFPKTPVLIENISTLTGIVNSCLLYTSPSPRD